MRTTSTPTSVPARHRAQLRAIDVSLHRGAVPVLTAVDLTVTPASRIAIVGENGRGKSSLLHVLAGSIVPDTGTVQRLGTLAMAEQELHANDDATVGQTVARAIAEPLAALQELDAAGVHLADEAELGAERFAAALERAEALDAWDAERRVRVALEALGAETEPTTRLAELSVGQRYRVRLACLLGADHDFLLLDEPSNHLDRTGLDFLTEQLRQRAGGVVIVSHDRTLLQDFAETIVDLDPSEDARPSIHGGGYTGFREGRARERERWQQNYERQQQERARLQEQLATARDRLVSGWRPDKGSDKHGRATRAAGLAQSVHRRQDALEAQLVTVPEPPQQLRFPTLAVRRGAVLLSVDEVSVAGRLQQPVSLELRAGSRLVVTGSNGAGKSTLLSVLAQTLQPDAGTVQTSPGTRVAHLSQESTLPLERRAAELFDERLGALDDRERRAGGDRDVVTGVGLAQLGLLRPSETSKRVGELSMGQRRRLDLAFALAAAPHVLLLDEPSNHLSIALVDELTEALDSTDAAVVLTTHDRQLLRDVDEWPHLQLSGCAKGGRRE